MTDTQKASPKKLINSESTKTELNNKLLAAAFSGEFNKVNELILADADVNSLDESGKTPLMLAAQQGHVNVINVLLNSPSILINKPDKIGNTALMFAAEEGYITAVIALLQSSNIALDQVNDAKETALDKAYQNSYNGIVNVLRRRGAVLSDESKTPSIASPTKAVIFSISEEEGKSRSSSPAAAHPVEHTRHRRRRGPKNCSLS